MDQLLTPIHQAYKQYRECRSIKDPSIRYRFLENTVAAFIKIASTTVLLTAKDYSNQIYTKAALEVFSSSSLGGWVNALKSIVIRSKEFPTKQTDYFNSYVAGAQELQKESIEVIQSNINQILKEFEGKGYKCVHLKNPNLLAIFEKIVVIRNKLAHGALDIELLSKIEACYAKAVKQLLILMPLNNFELYGKVGSYVKVFRGDSQYLDKDCSDCSLWFEGPLFKDGFASPSPFLSYNKDNQDIFFLNDFVKDSQTEAEYILYRNGQIIYGPVLFDWSSVVQGKLVTSITFARYKQHREFLATVAKDWKRLAINMSALSSIDDGTPCVYVFQVPLKVLGNSNRHILYVGKTQELQTRLKTYIKTQKGYDDSRPEIMRMFDTYATDIELWYRRCSTRQEIAKIENAVYESYKPEFNLLKPPNN